VFGSHVANVLRRLRRIANAYGTEPRFLLASATIANPVDLAQRLTGLEDIALIDHDGAPAHERRVALWNPPLEDEALGRRRSVLGEASELLAELVQQGARTICFMKSRKAVELIARFTTLRLTEEAPELADKVAPYRAGYTPQQRRELEARLVAGDLLGVVATNALELGIDVGALDAAICVTYPGTVASLRQMWGRAGRRDRGLAMFVAGEDALDQFFCRHPDEFLDRPVEAAILDHASEQIYMQHLLCAAHEGPLEALDTATLGAGWRDAADRLVSMGELRERAGRYTLRHPEDFPAARASLRSAAADSVTVVDAGSGELLGTVETARAFSTVHQGAVYLHLGRSYEVEALDVEQRRAIVRPFSGDWYTQAKRETETVIERLLDRRETMGVRLSFGVVSVTEQVLAYQRKGLADHEARDLIALDLPETTFTTQALWYELEEGVLAGEFPLELLLGSLHAAEHGQIAVLPLIAMCDRWDIGGLSTNFHAQTCKPTIFIYDGHPGGVGITRRGFEAFETLVADAHRLISECPCKAGCPSCVQSPKCGNLNEPLAKHGAVEMMARMLER
jgi:DEAD/DEAH box helicase domain-containing protein